MLAVFLNHQFTGNGKIMNNCLQDSSLISNILSNNNFVKHLFLNIYSILFRGNVLENPATNKEDRGNYYCSALNGVDPIPKRKIGVVVEFPPIVTTSLQIHRQALNYHVDLDCRIQACPTSTVVWMFRGMQLTNNQYFT